MKQKFYLLITLFAILSSTLHAQSLGQQVKPFLGQPGIKKKISELRINERLNSVSEKTLDTTAIKPYYSIFRRNQNTGKPQRLGRNMNRFQGLKSLNSNTLKGLWDGSAESTDNNSGSTQKIGSDFLALDFNDNPIGWPPDPNGAVSNTQIIVATNNGIKVFEKPTKNNSPLLTPTGYSDQKASSVLFVSLEEFFSPVLPKGSYISDPHIRYDRLSKRWFVVAIDYNPYLPGDLLFLAVSDGDRITESSDFTYYAFISSLLPDGQYPPFLDFPTLGVDKNSVLIGGNLFGDSLINVGYVIDKKKLLQGELVVYPFELGVESNVTAEGMYTPQGVYNDDPSGKRSFFAGISYNLDGIRLASFDYDKENKPRLSSQIKIPVEQWNFPRYDISSLGAQTNIERNDTRLLAAAIYKNKITGKSSLWTSHAIGVDVSGHHVDYTSINVSGKTASRWYEIGDIYAKPELHQQGTLYDAEQKSGRRAVEYFNPSIAASGQGHAVLSGTTDAFDQYLNVFVAGRFNGDPRGTLKPPVKATNTTAIYAPYIVDFFGNFYMGRWGDFSQTVVDPSDDQTIWTFQEYADVDDSYGVRVVEVKAPPPATPVPFNPLDNKKDNNITLEGISPENSGFFDAGKDNDGPGYNKLTVKSTGDIGVKDLQFVTPTKLTFTLNTKNRPAGKYTLTITNPDGQFVTVDYQIKADAKREIVSNVSTNAKKTSGNKIPQAFVTRSGVFPNPATAKTTIQINAAREYQSKIVLSDINGKIVFERSYNLVKGNNQISLSLEKYSKGTYIVSVYNSDNVLTATHKIVKQ